MNTRRGEAYIVLEDSGAAALLPAQQQSLETALLAALSAPSLWGAPSPTFVADLERDLLVAAQRRRRALHLLGAVGGGALSLLGGALVWYFWRRQQEPINAPKPSAFGLRSAGIGRVRATFS